MLRKVNYCTTHILANTMPHHLHWDDEEMGVDISCTKNSQVAVLIHIITGAYVWQSSD